MAKIITNNKEFKIIELSQEELFSIGGLALCDGCNSKLTKGFYIAVLNSTYCESDYLNWSKNAVRYDEDISYENAKFSRMKAYFNLQ